MKGAAMSKFLTYEERLVITRGLSEHKSFGVIAREIGKDRTTVAKEIKKHAYEKKSGRPGYPYNACLFRVDCKHKYVCGEEACTRGSSYKCRRLSSMTGVSGTPICSIAMPEALTKKARLR